MDNNADEQQMTSDERSREKTSLEGSIDSLGRWMIFFTGMVAVGLVIEYRAPFVLFYKTHDLRVFLASIGGLLVTAGVAGEWLIEFRAHRKEKTLRTLNEEIEADSETRLKSADERIAELNLERAKIEEKLLRTLGPRKIDDAKRARLSALVADLWIPGLPINRNLAAIGANFGSRPPQASTCADAEAARRPRNAKLSALVGGTPSSG